MSWSLVVWFLVQKEKRRSNLSPIRCRVLLLLPCAEDSWPIAVQRLYCDQADRFTRRIGQSYGGTLDTMTTSTTNEPARFFQAILESMQEQIAVIDGDGTIRYVNRPWLEFCRANDGPEDLDWTGVSYLEVCDRAARQGDEDGGSAAEGIRRLAQGLETEYNLEYPCHSPTEKRWFVARMTPLMSDEGDYFVITHQNITERKLSEEKVEELLRTDSLTEIANRHRFDEFLDQEWRRAMRAGHRFSLLLLDIDHFKAFNDHYGHQRGDEALHAVAGALAALVGRASDLVARYGGEELAIILGNSTQEQAVEIADRALEAIRNLEIAHKHSDVGPIVTVSVGVATMTPAEGDKPEQLVAAADEALYKAKDQGRDRACVHPDAD